MATTREKISRLELGWIKESSKPWQCLSYSRRWLKQQMNRYIRRQLKQIDPEDVGRKQGRKPYWGWEW